MSTLPASAVDTIPSADLSKTWVGWRVLLHDRQIDRLAMALALCAVPVSIAASEAFLAVAIVARGVRLAQRKASLRIPGVFWFWLPWAAAEVIRWSLSAERGAGWSEIRHLLLIAGLFFALPALDRESDRLAIWKGIFLTGGLASLFLIGDFLDRLVMFRRELRVDLDPSLYLRTGGLLNNWMVYGSVEILIVAALLSFWCFYPEERRRWWPVVVAHLLAIILSLTRMTWATCLLLLGMVLIWRRSKWLWVLPVLPLTLYALAPRVIRARMRESLRLDYYSNAERREMLRVGWRMVCERPLTGVGPGQVGRLYRNYLSPGEPVPAYYGHLHNNLVQLAAEFGLPAVLAALFFLAALLRQLQGAWKRAKSQQHRFSCLNAFLALCGFLIAGLFDYTYGHSLALILASFSILSPLLPSREATSGTAIA